MPTKSAITFFAGCGGACTGLEQAGIPVIWANEYDPLIGDIWQLNHTVELNRQDILSLAISQIPDADILWASPPCQSHSIAKQNRTGGTDKEDTQIAVKLGEIIQAKLPEAVVIENVPGYAKSHSFDHLTTVLSFCGYNVAWSVLNAADYGVPQSRTRLILVARLRAIAALPPATHDSVNWWQPDKANWWWAIFDLAYENLLAPTELSAPQMEALDKRGLTNSPKFPHLIQLTGYYKKRGPTVRWFTEPAPTITAHMAHDGKLNKLGYPSFRSPFTIWAYGTAYKADLSCLARWQTFPDSFRWGPSKGIAAKAIGNAVPCGLAEAIGRHLLVNW